MNHTLALNIDNSSVEERDFFELIASEPVPDVSSTLDTLFRNAKKMMCVVLSDLSPFIVNSLSGLKCSRYILVPDINSKALNPLKNKTIIRQMKWSGFNIFIADDVLAVITSNGCGTLVEDKETVKILSAHFRRWFWNDSDFELIDSVFGVDNGVFDIPPVPSEKKVVSDSDEIISILTQKCDSVSFEGKYHRILDDKNLYFSKIPDLSVLKANRKESFFVPQLWTHFCEVDGDKYILNYNPAAYPTMPEKGSSKLLGIRVDALDIGATYRYRQKELYSKLVGKTLKDSKGNDILILSSASEEVSLTLSLKDFVFFKKLESENNQMLEDRLRSRNPNMLVSSKRACILNFNISVDILKHNPKFNKDPIYQEYSNMPKNLLQKRDEIIKLANGEKLDKLSDKVKAIQIPDSFSEVAAYNSLVNELNKYVDEFNSRGGEIDESLAEVSSTKGSSKVKIIEKLKESNVKPLPRFGTLYRNGASYEYVLSDEKMLSDAEKEAEERGWKTITYHLE